MGVYLVEDPFIEALEAKGGGEFDGQSKSRGIRPDLEGLIVPLRPLVSGTLGGQATRGFEMAKAVHGEPARVGDEIVVARHSVGMASRTAVILEVLGEPGHERFRVPWEDGHESVFSPADDAVLRRPVKKTESTN